MPVYNAETMSIVTSIPFNAFQENTYIISDGKEAIIVDPGCHSVSEQKQLSDKIDSLGVVVKYCLNTHCHLDHIFGNKYVVDTYGVDLVMHEGELPLLRQAPMIANMYGLSIEPSPEPSRFLTHGDTFTFADTVFNVLLTPGHSPASISFFNQAEGYVLAGDVLFQNSIGRTDLPGGDQDTLFRSIKDHYLSLPDDVIVYPGHGPATTIGEERRSNPFLQNL